MVRVIQSHHSTGHGQTLVVQLYMYRKGRTVALVVDTSVIIAVLVSEPEREALIQVTRGAELMAPESVHWEVGNALAAMLKRGRITIEQAQRAIDAYQEIPLRRVDVDLKLSLEIADARGIYAYDAYVVAAGIRHRSSVLTLDRGLTAAAKASGCRVIEVAR